MIYICTHAAALLLQTTSSFSSHLRTLVFAVFYFLIATAFSKETACKIWKSGNTSEFTSHHSWLLLDFFPSANPDESEVLKGGKTQGKSVLGQESMYERKKPSSTRTTAIKRNFLPLQGEGSWCYVQLNFKLCFLFIMIRMCVAHCHVTCNQYLNISYCIFWVSSGSKVQILWVNLNCYTLGKVESAAQRATALLFNSYTILSFFY